MPANAVSDHPSPSSLKKTYPGKGYPGRYRQGARVVAPRRQGERTGHPLPGDTLLPALGWTPTRAVGLLRTHPRERTPEGQLAIERLRARHSALRTAGQLLEGFAHLLRDKTDPSLAQRHHQLDQWTRQAARSGLPDFETFVAKLRQDTNAVVAALTLPDSQGRRTEGQVTRLEVRKRTMFGRGTFDLLRQRMRYTVAA